MVDLIGALSLTFGLFASLLSLPALIIPRCMGISHRIYALPMMLAPVGLMGLFFALFPSQLGNEDGSAKRAISVFFLAVWMIAIGIAMKVTKRSREQGAIVGFWRGLYERWGYGFNFRATRARQRRAAQFGFWPELKAGWMTPADFEVFIAKLEAKHGVVNDRVAAQAENGEAEKERSASLSQNTSYIRDLLWDDTDGRLNAMYEDYRAGLATLDDYEAAIVSEAEGIRERSAHLRENRRLYDAEQYDAEKDQLDEDRDAVQWRMRWLSGERLRLKNSRTDFEPAGKWARFEYVDADGVITNRHIVNWERRGAYIVGHDKDRREERTFRQDRISDWLAG